LKILKKCIEILIENNEKYLKLEVVKEAIKSFELAKTKKLK